VSVDTGVPLGSTSASDLGAPAAAPAQRT
jgi:hypothetical protein